MASMVVYVDEEAAFKELYPGFSKNVYQVRRYFLVPNETQECFDGRVKQKHSILTFEAKVVVVEMQDERGFVLSMPT